MPRQRRSSAAVYFDGGTGRPQVVAYSGKVECGGRSIFGYFFGWAKSKLDALTAVDGSKSIVISYHLPDPATPTPTPTPRASAPPTSPASRAIDVCALLSAAEASAPGGIWYGSATPKHVANGWDQCLYANTGHADPVDIQELKVSVVSIPNCFENLKSVREDANGDTTAVPGIGERAFGYRIGLVVQTGSRCVEVQGMTHADSRTTTAATSHWRAS